MGFRGTPPASGATNPDAFLALQALAIMPIVGTIVGMFVVVGFAAVTIGAFAGAVNYPRLNRIDRTGTRRIADVRGDDRGGALYR